MKKIILCLIILMLVYSAGCKEKEVPSGNIVGGYIFNNALGGEVPDVARQAFSEACLSSDYLLLTCLGISEKDNFDYLFLAKKLNVSSEEQELKVIKVHKSISTSAEVTKISDFNLRDYLGHSDEIKLFENRKVTVPDELRMTKMPQNLATITSEAFFRFMNIHLDAVAFIGEQLVAGKNYAFVCKGETTSTDPKLFVVVIYQDLKSNIKVNSICQIDLDELSK